MTIGSNFIPNPNNEITFLKQGTSTSISRE